MAQQRTDPPGDEAIREALITRLGRRLGKRERTTVMHELGLREGRARIDIAVVTDRLHGYEIKSDRDDASRLGRQILIYGAVLDRVTLVAGSKAARWALKRIPCALRFPRLRPLVASQPFRFRRPGPRRRTQAPRQRRHRYGVSASGPEGR